MKIVVDDALTYESDVPVEIGDIVELPANNFVDSSWLAKVTSLDSKYEGPLKKIISNHGKVKNAKTLLKISVRYREAMKKMRAREQQKVIELALEKCPYRKVELNYKYSVWSCKIKLAIGDRVIVRKLHGDKKNWTGVVTQLLDARHSLDYEVKNIILEKETDDAR